MIRTFILAALVGFCVAQPLSAASARVQSGEHATFSRLVFPDTPERTWRLERPTPALAEVVFSDGASDLDLSRIFDLIPRDRLQNVEFAAGTLTLTLGCDCTVDVSHIASGHIIIDIGDGAPQAESEPIAKLDITPSPAATREPLLPVVLPLRTLTGPVRAKPIGPLKTDIDVMIDDISGPPQVQFHPLGNIPLTLIDPNPQRDVQTVEACPIEALAAESLLRDPKEALGSFEGQIATLLEGGDVLDPSAITRLAQLYLAIGWGAEAMQVASANSPDQTALATIAAALDGVRNPGGPTPDPGCGPATAVIALLSTEGPSGWDRTDHRAVTSFLDRMATDRWRDMKSRLDLALREVDSSDLLIGLGPATDDMTDPPATDAEAAGTDIAAVDATLEVLVRALSKGSSASDLHVANALALRPSIPEGQRRDRLDTLLAETFVVARRPNEAVAMVVSGNASGPDILDLALRHLAPSEAAEFAARLRPHLTGFPLARRKAEALFLGLDLPEIARRFADGDAPAQDIIPIEAITTLSDVDPWLSRNMTALVSAPADTWNNRNRLAQAIVSRNSNDVPQTDLAAAEMVLLESRTLSDIVARLIRAP